MGMKLGLNGVLYYLATGNRATWGTADADGIHEGAAPAALAVVSRVRDLSIGLEKGEADLSTRDNAGWGADVPTLKRASLTFDIVWDSAKASQVALLKSYLLNTPIACAALDGDKAVADVEGFWADFMVSGFDKAEELTEGQMVSITLKPTLTDVPPEWVRVAAGA